MKKYKRVTAALLSLSMAVGLYGCAGKPEDTRSMEEIGGSTEENGIGQSDAKEKESIEQALNLAYNEGQEWTYSKEDDAWALSVVSAVAYPELPDQQGVSVCVPGAYITGIDTDGDGSVDVTSENAADAVNGSLVIDYETKVTSTNGQVYTAATAPVIINTGAAGYGSQNNSVASASHAADGYINVACGNRGKQDTVTDDEGNAYYTGDAPSCLVDQKAAARYVKYNILLGNLPGNTDCFVSTGGSGGGAHAAMFAAASNNSDYYDYQIEAGAVGVYKNEDGSYSTTVTIDGQDYEISDGAWGCIAYSAITPLYEADMALAFEYYLNSEYAFKTSFQAQLAEYLSEAYMEYINGQSLSVAESAVGFDLNHDGDMDDTVALTIEHDPEAYADTNGYYGTYLDLYMAEFTQNLQWYLDNLDYAEGWTWFDENGNALSNDTVMAMSGEDKAQAFLEGRYAKGSSGGMMGGGMPGGDMPGGGRPGDGNKPDGDMPGGGRPDGRKTDGNRSDGDMPGGGRPDGKELDGNKPDGDMPGGGRPDGNIPDRDMSDDEMPDGGPGGTPPDGNADDGGPEGGVPDNRSEEMIVGTPDGGTTQSATGSGDSANYESYADMAAAYKSDIEEINAGDKYGNNIVSLYNPLNYIGAGDTDDPTWAKIMMGASEGDMSLFNSLNLQIAWLNAGVDAEIEWQWDGGHVPSEVLGDSFSLYVDQMYGEYVAGSVSISKPEAEGQTENGTAEEATGKDISGWINCEDTSAVAFTLKDIAAYRTAGASKATPGFDVIDYGQEDYVFGNTEKDARHWNTYLLEIFEKHADVLEPLFNGNE